MNNLEALIFDLDGTLADTMPVHYQSYLKVFKPYQIQFPENRFYEMAGIPCQQIVEILAEEHHIKLDTHKIAEQKDDLYHDMLDQIQPIQKIVDIVKKNLKIGTPMAIATGSKRDSAQKTLRAIELENCFQVIVCAEDTPKPKPEPDVFLIAAKQLSVKPENCTVFEDSWLGIQGAKSAGMKAIHIDSVKA